MFTGIIENKALLIAYDDRGTNRTFCFESEIAAELKIDQSLSHNGVCLTVVHIDGLQYYVTAIDETLKKTNLGLLQKDDWVNLERCMPANGRFDGHIVQGHVDQTGVCTNRIDENGSWQFDFEYNAEYQNITVEKGSICINGVSLTCFNSGSNTFSVAIIPYTFEHTNFKSLKIGDLVNLEFDIVGKYIKKLATIA
ncbi:MAG: riboflavin synthase [Bacteroidota bacterium]